MKIHEIIFPLAEGLVVYQFISYVRATEMEAGNLESQRNFFLVVFLTNNKYDAFIFKKSRSYSLAVA